MSWKPWKIRIFFISHEIIRNNGITWYLQNDPGERNASWRRSWHGELNFQSPIISCRDFNRSLQKQNFSRKFGGGYKLSRRYSRLCSSIQQINPKDQNNEIYGRPTNKIIIKDNLKVSNCHLVESDSTKCLGLLGLFKSHLNCLSMV